MLFSAMRWGVATALPAVAFACMGSTTDNERFQRSGAPRDAFASLSADTSLDKQVLSVALDIAHVRVKFLNEMRQSLKERIESAAGVELGTADSTLTSKWHNQASGIANACILKIKLIRKLILNEIY